MIITDKVCSNWLDTLPVLHCANGYNKKECLYYFRDERALVVHHASDPNPNYKDIWLAMKYGI